MPRFTDLITQEFYSNRARFEKFNLEGGYPFVPVHSAGWRDSPTRLLVVLESVDSLDIFNGDLLSGSYDSSAPRFLDSRQRNPNGHNPMLSVLPNVLDRALEHLGQYPDHLRDTFPLEIWDEAELAVVNFAAAKSRHLPEQEQRAMNTRFVSRLLPIIKLLSPTHILISGDTAAYLLHEQWGTAVDKSYHPYTRGWVRDVEIDGKPVKVTHTIDFELMYNPPKRDDEDDEGDSDSYGAGDLLYFCTRNVANLLVGRLVHDISGIKPKAEYISTREQFDWLMGKLEAAPRFALDSETRNLTNTDNAIYYLQFAITRKVGYVIPLEHPKSPFSKTDQRYIKRRLKDFFGDPQYEHQEVLFHTGSFDLRMLRSQLDLKMVMRRVYDIPAAEQLLDENLGLLSSRFKVNFNGGFKSFSYGGLSPMCLMYGQDFYVRGTTKFSKAERATAGNFEPDDPDVLLYAAADVQVLIGIAKEQASRAAALRMRAPFTGEEVSYLPWFRAHVPNQGGATVQSISMMEQSGSPVDIHYLKGLLKPDSPLLGVIADAADRLRAMPQVVDANASLLESAGLRSIGLFSNEAITLFNPDKREHIEQLFLRTLALEPVAFTGKGTPSLGKAFLTAYRDSNPEVAAYETYVKAKKLFSAFVKGWLVKVNSDIDSLREATLRPGFGFFTIVSGRLNSFGPSLQQIPARGPLSKYIKRMFIAPRGYLIFKADYSAHEVRMWAVLARELLLAHAFQVGLDLRRKLILCTDPEQRKELLAELKKSGDIHIQSVFRFFGKWVEKSDPLRDAVKAVVFGVLYGKSVKTLARDLRGQRIGELIKKHYDLKKEMDGIRKKSPRTPEDVERADAIVLASKAIEKDLKDAEVFDWEAFAQEILDKMFNEFPDGAKYLQDCLSSSQAEFQVASPIGRVRHLWRSASGIRGMISAAGRRAQNSPIQGIASEVGTAAAYRTMRECYLWLREHSDFNPEGDSMDVMPRYCRAVHDCNVFAVPYLFMLPFLHIYCFTATTGVATWYKEVFNLDFPVIPEIEVEIAAEEATSLKWDWQIHTLLELLYKSLLRQVQLGGLHEEDFDWAWSSILYPWKSKVLRKELCTRYPILDVDVSDVVVKHLKAFVPPTL